jgi:Raf kinase inhibitor-like YbhB/YbcL family protein
MRKVLPVRGVLVCGPAVAMLALAAGTLGCAGRPQPGAPPMKKLTVRSTAFQEGQPIPARHTGDGKDLPPPLEWDAPPEGTRSFALVCEDPDAPRGTWTHWVLFNLPADARAVDEAVPRDRTLPNGAAQGTNDFGNIGYNGPAPPPGKPHRYFFKLYALDTRLEGLQPGVTRRQLLDAMQGHVLAEGQTMGTYGRPKK